MSFVQNRQREFLLQTCAIAWTRWKLLCIRLDRMYMIQSREISIIIIEILYGRLAGIVSLSNAVTPNIFHPLLSNTLHSTSRI